MADNSPLSPGRGAAKGWRVGLLVRRSRPVAGDEAVLKAFACRQELPRAPKLFSLYAVAFSVISITDGVTLNYGYAIDHFGPVCIWTWLVAGGAQLVVALVIAELGTRMLAGYTYQWCGRLMTSTYGWFVVSISLGDNAPGAVGRRSRLGLPASPSVPAGPWTGVPAGPWTGVRAGPWPESSSPR